MKMLNPAVVKQSVQMSLQNIRSNKMRSFLTMLGIMIGVTSVIALITIVQIVSDSVMGEFSSLGAGTLTIMASSSPMKNGLTDNDIKELEAIDGVDGVSPTVSLTTASVVDGEVYENTSVEGKSDIYFMHDADIITGGRGLNHMDMSGDTYVCIVDPKYVKTAMLGHKVLGSEILIGGFRYTVVGVRGKDESMSSFMSDSSGLDGTVIIPYRNALSMTGSNDVNSAEVYVNPAYSMSDVEESIRNKLKNMYNENDDYYSVINLESMMDMMNSVQGMMGTMLGGIASIALLVGGIGIMNMMLTSVSERTKEIGLRKALGAEPSRIQAQFLIESVVLSVCGGIIGILFGLLIAFVAAKLLKTAFIISWGAVALGFGFSGAVGVIFGWMPAKRASELNPIDALRSE